MGYVVCGGGGGDKRLERRDGRWEVESGYGRRDIGVSCRWKDVRLSDYIDRYMEYDGEVCDAIGLRWDIFDWMDLIGWI